MPGEGILRLPGITVNAHLERGGGMKGKSLVYVFSSIAVWKLFGCPFISCHSVQLKVSFRVPVHVSNDNSNTTQTKRLIIWLTSNHCFLSNTLMMRRFNRCALLIIMITFCFLVDVRSIWT